MGSEPLDVSLAVPEVGLVPVGPTDTAVELAVG